ncbi:conserved hypothetical protein [Vibrio nigripulchritudo MADA3029]|nr:conserved hypothetical protein [Vibrio nigripulchritudo MADA3020]CCN55288.1 conserved hypothetical protein [Vibrio nigripulchritudo MADA3021]CCN58004.1 conserved hypothetical protein [Vibrio nigripulchritudo MADA3029]
MKIFKLHSDVTNLCSFIEDYPEGVESIMGVSMDRKWLPFGEEYTSRNLELRSNDIGERNYFFDISGALSPFFVFSENAVETLQDILLKRGQLLPVITQSKEKKFFGYYPTNPLTNCFDREKSVYREYPNGLMIRKHSLIKDNIEDEYLFTIEEDISSVFVTDKFVERVKNSGLVGFDFSSEIEVN